MRRNILIAVLAAVAVLVAYFFLLFSPQSKNIEKAKADVVAAETSVRQLELQLQHLQALQQQAPKLREEAAKLDAAVPNDAQEGDFINRVQDAANASGVEWISVSPAPPAAGAQPGVLEIAITMSVEGGY